MDDRIKTILVYEATLGGGIRKYVHSIQRWCQEINTLLDEAETAAMSEDLEGARSAIQRLLDSEPTSNIQIWCNELNTTLKKLLGMTRQ